VPLVLLNPENNDDFCLGCIGRDIDCLMKRDYCDAAKHERQNMNVTQACVHIMAHAMKHTKFAAYHAPYVKFSQLMQSQYGQLAREQHSVSDWNRILFASNQANCEDDMDFEEVKIRAAKKSGSMPDFTLSKRVKFEGYDAADDTFILMEVPSATDTLLKPAVSRSEEGAFALTEDAWDAVSVYLTMLDKTLPELQTVMATSELVMGVEDELGAMVAELGSGTELPGGPYVNVWSGLGVALENNQPVASLVGRIHQQVRNIAGSVDQAIQKANQASANIVGVRSQVVQVSKQQRGGGG
jgi:hypothetical protein